MNMKNKLYKHHKSKSSFVVRELSFSVLGLSLVALAVALPAYFSTHKDEKVPTLAESEEVVEIDNNEEVSILSYNEEK